MKIVLPNELSSMELDLLQILFNEFAICHQQTSIAYGMFASVLENLGGEESDMYKEARKVEKNLRSAGF